MKCTQLGRISKIELELNDSDFSDLVEWRSMLDAFGQKETSGCADFLTDIMKAARPDLYK